LAQLEQLDSFVLRRRDNADFYKARLSHIPNIQFQQHEVFCQPNQWLFSILIPEKEALMACLLAAEIACRSIWTPMHQLPIYQHASLWTRFQSEHEASESKRIFDRGLSLPSSASLTEDKIDHICSVIEAFANG